MLESACVDRAYTGSLGQVTETKKKEKKKKKVVGNPRTGHAPRAVQLNIKLVCLPQLWQEH